MKRSLMAAAAVLAVAMTSDASVNAQSQDVSAQSGPPVLAKEIAPPRQGARLRVTSPAFSSGHTLDENYTQDGENMSPPLEWGKGPAGTRSYVVIAEDASVNRPEPIVHWILYNIPSGVTRLSRDMAMDATLSNGAMQGKTVKGSPGYVGPKPPAGQTHAYHFQVFALNTSLDIEPAQADRKAVLNAMKGRVVAAGDIIADYTGR
jgi:Raf kinase inhibitor-like YbhB/YbcL family protein